MSGQVAVGEWLGRVWWAGWVAVGEWAGWVVLGKAGGSGCGWRRVVWAQRCGV